MATDKEIDELFDTIDSIRSDKNSAKFRNAETDSNNLFKDDRIDSDDEGKLDDIVINDVECFRMEKMSDTCFWIRLYRKNGEDIVFFLNSIINSDGITLGSELEGSWHFDGRPSDEVSD